MLNQFNKTHKIEFDSKISTKEKSEFVEKLCNYCQENGKEIKDCKPDYYAWHFLYDQFSRLEKDAFTNQITDPFFEGLNETLASWILAARLEKILEGTYTSNSGPITQNKEGFLIFRGYFTKKHAILSHLWKIIEKCLQSICAEQKFTKPTTKETYIEACNWTRLYCQQRINDTICGRISPVRCGSCKQNRLSTTLQKSSEPKAVHVIYENNAFNESLEWECQMKEATIASLREQLGLLQWELDKQINNKDEKNNENAECRKAEDSDLYFYCNEQDTNGSWEHPWALSNDMDVDLNSSSIDTSMEEEGKGEV